MTKRGKIPCTHLEIMGLMPQKYKFAQRTTEPYLFVVVYPNGSRFLRVRLGNFDYSIGKYPDISIEEAIDRKNIVRHDYINFGKLPEKRRGVLPAVQREKKFNDLDWFKKLVRVRNDLTRTLKEIDFVLKTNEMIDEQ